MYPDTRSQSFTSIVDVQETSFSILAVVDITDEYTRFLRCSPTFTVSIKLNHAGILLLLPRLILPTISVPPLSR